MIITVSSVSGAPGVTSWALLLAAAIPPDVDLDRIVVEADPDGGVLGARYGIGVEPGLNSLIAATRHAESGLVDIDSIGRRIGPRVLVVPSPETAERCSLLWSGAGVAGEVARFAANDSRLWVIDVGRSSSSSAVAELMAHARINVVISRPNQEALVQVPSRVADLRQLGRPVGVLVNGTSSFAHADLVAFFGASATWTVKGHDDLVTFTRRIYVEEKSRRSLTWRAAVDLAADVMTQAAATAIGPEPTMVT